MQDELTSLMLGFGERARGYRAQLTDDILMEAEISERDLRILELLHKRGELVFSDVVAGLQPVRRKQVSSSTVSQAVTALSQRSTPLVEKRINPADQRRPLIKLTPEGSRIAKAMEAVHARVIEQIAEAMRPTDREAAVLRRVFARGRDRFDECVQRAGEFRVPS